MRSGVIYRLLSGTIIGLSLLIWFPTVGQVNDVQRGDYGQRSLQISLNLHTRAFPKYLVLPQSGKQELYIVVLDQLQLPVEGAMITLTIRMPSGRVERVVLPRHTDEHGIARYAFGFEDQPTGLVEIQATATFRQFQNTTRTCFRIWW